MLYLSYVAAREREKTQKRLEQSQSAAASRTASPAPKSKKGVAAKLKSGTSTPAKASAVGVDQRVLDLSGLNLNMNEVRSTTVAEEAPKMSLAKEKLLEEAKKVIEGEGAERKKEISLVVIGKLDFEWRDFEWMFVPCRSCRRRQIDADGKDVI